MIQNEMMLTDDNSLEISLKNAVQSYCSFTPQTREDKVRFFNSVNSPQKRLRECVNMEIHLKDIYAERCEFINRESNEVTPGVRIVFIDADGVSYQAASKGVFTSTQKLLQIMGEPATWEEPVTVVPKQISKGVNQNVLVFEIK